MKVFFFNAHKVTAEQLETQICDWLKNNTVDVYMEDAWIQEMGVGNIIMILPYELLKPKKSRKRKAVGKKISKKK